MTAGDIATLAVVCALVVAVIVARRRGRQQYAAAMASARSEAAAQAVAEFKAQLAQVVNVSVNSHPRESLGSASYGPAWSDEDAALADALARLDAAGFYRGPFDEPDDLPAIDRRDHALGSGQSGHPSFGHRGGDWGAPDRYLDRRVRRAGDTPLNG